MQKQEFAIADILSAATGVLCGDMDGVYDILNFMTGDDLYTTQLPRASEEAAPYLIEQFPWLRDIDCNWLAGEGCLDRVAQLAEKYGAVHMVQPMHPEDHEVIDPIEEIHRMRPDLPVIAIDAEGETESPSAYGDINWK